MIHENEIVVRPALDSDGVEVFKLLRALGLNLPEAERDMASQWNWLWKLNPYYKQFHEDIQFGWVLEHEQRIVGFFGSIQRIYLFNSKPIRVSIASRWGVEKEYRTFTTLLSDQYFRNNACPLKIVTTAIKPTGRIFLKYGGRKIPNEKLGDVYMVPISLFRLIAVKFRSPVIRSMFGMLHKIAPWKIQYRSIRKNENVAKVDIVDIENKLNAFFRSFESDATGLVAVRSSDILKWQGSGHGNKQGKEYFIHKTNEEISGFASISKEGIAKDPDLIRYKITDLIATSARTRKALIKELVRYAYSKNADVVEIYHPGMIDKSDIPLPIVLTRKHAHFPLYYQTDEENLGSALALASNWNISPFDGDTSL